MQRATIHHESSALTLTDHSIEVEVVSECEGVEVIRGSKCIPPAREDFGTTSRFLTSSLPLVLISAIFSHFSISSFPHLPLLLGSGCPALFMSFSHPIISNPFSIPTTFIRSAPLLLLFGNTTRGIQEDLDSRPKNSHNPRIL